MNARCKGGLGAADDCTIYDVGAGGHSDDRQGCVTINSVELAKLTVHFAYERNCSRSVIA